MTNEAKTFLTNYPDLTVYFGSTSVGKEAQKLMRHSRPLYQELRGIAAERGICPGDNRFQPQAEQTSLQLTETAETITLEELRASVEATIERIERQQY